MQFSDRLNACTRQLLQLELLSACISLETRGAGPGDLSQLMRLVSPGELRQVGPVLLRDAPGPRIAPRNDDRSLAGHSYRPGAVPRAAGQPGGRLWLAARAARPPPGYTAPDIPAARIAAVAGSSVRRLQRRLVAYDKKRATVATAPPGAARENVIGAQVPSRKPRRRGAWSCRPPVYP